MNDNVAKNNFDEQVSLIKVKRNNEHAIILYDLLKQRTHKISHKSLPSFNEHLAFIINHPYRAWFFIGVNGSYIGSIYAYKNNGIGVSVNPGKEIYIRQAIVIFLKKMKPLRPIKSVRSAEFGVYAAPTDKHLISILESLGARLSQVTYLFDLK